MSLLLLFGSSAAQVVPGVVQHGRAGKRRRNTVEFYYPARKKDLRKVAEVIFNLEKAQDGQDRAEHIDAALDLADKLEFQAADRLRLAILAIDLSHIPRGQITAALVIARGVETEIQQQEDDEETAFLLLV